MQDLQADPLLSGAMLVDGYKVLPPCVLYEPVGRGAMGAVYRGHHLNLDIEVAVKCLKPELVAEDGTFVDRFKREARAAAQINHQNVIRVFDVAEHAGLHYLVMEYVAGETAGQRVRRRGPLPIDEALQIVHDASLGLGDAHRVDIVHRDIKPENLLISSRGQVKVADLGIARPGFDGGRSEMTVDGQVIGTPSYMSPEQWENPSVTAASDVWSMGAVIYYLLTGRRARSADSVYQLMGRAREPFPDVRELRPDVSDALAEVLVKATALSPADRYRDGNELAEAIGSLLQQRVSLVDDGATVGAREAGRSPPQSRVNEIKRTLFQTGTFLGSGSDADETETQPAIQTSRAPVGHRVLLLVGLVLILIAMAASLVPSDEPTAPWGLGYRESVLGVVGIVFTLTAVRWSRRWAKGRVRIESTAEGIEDEPADSTVNPPRPPSRPSPVVPPGVTIVGPLRTDIASGLDRQREDAAVRALPAPPDADATMAMAPSATRLSVAVAVQKSPDASRLGSRIRIERFPFSIGRDKNCDLTLDDHRLSRKHASILSESQTFVLRDHGSANGTFVNGRKVGGDESVALFFGDELTLANSVLTFVGDAAPLPDLTGLVLAGQFRLRKCLHSSVKAATYAATDERLSRDLTIKIFSPRLHHLANYRDQVRREAELGARLQHPHVGKVFDLREAQVRIGDVPTTVEFLTLEYLRGGNLASRLAGEPLPPARAVGWLKSLAGALHYAHQQGVVHGALKPSSVLFDDSDHPYLVDFASGLVVGDDDWTPAFGAPAFLAPEQWLSEAPTAASDQYALAVLAYLLLTGKRPYEGQESPEVREQNFERGPISAHQRGAADGSDLMPATSVVLERALSCVAEDRFADPLEFAVALERSLSEEPAPLSRSVFISYHRSSSAPWAVMFRDALVRKQMEVFLDTDRRDSGGKIPDRIEAAIRDCDVFVCLLGKDTLSSAWVLAEVEMAHRFGRPCVPIFHEAFDPGRFREDPRDGVRALVSHEGVLLLDEKVQMVEHSISDLVRLVELLLAHR